MNKKLLGVLGVAALLLAGNFAWQEVKEVDAANLDAGTYVYFEKPSSWTANYVQLLLGHNSWSEGYTMTNIANTDIYYVKMIKWDGYTQFGFMNTNEEKWGGEGSSPSNRIQWGINKTNVAYADGLALDKDYNLFGGSATDPYAYPAKSDTLDDLNFSVSVNAGVGGSASVSGYELTSATAVTSKSGSSVNALKFTNATLTATVNEGYEFNGWYDAETGGNLVSSELTYTVKDVTEAKTYYARYTALETQETLSELLTRYFNSGSYTRNTTINLTPETMNELVSCFHAGNIVAERTTVFEGGALWMKNEAGTYSYYGTSGSNMTGGRVANVGDTVNTIAYTGKTMEEFYTTLCDIKDVDVSKWTQTGNVWTSDDATVIQQFLDFTAPCFLGLDNERAAYFTLSHVEVEETEDGLELRLVCSSVEEGKFEEGSNNVLSKAVITYEE